MQKGITYTYPAEIESQFGGTRGKIITILSLAFNNKLLLPKVDNIPTPYPWGKFLILQSSLYHINGCVLY